MSRFWWRFLRCVNSARHAKPFSGPAGWLAIRLFLGRERVILVIYTVNCGWWRSDAESTIPLFNNGCVIARYTVSFILVGSTICGIFVSLCIIKIITEMTLCIIKNNLFILNSRFYVFFLIQFIQKCSSMQQDHTKSDHSDSDTFKKYLKIVCIIMQANFLYE